MKKPRIAILTEIPVPYRAPVFDLLGANDRYEFDFVYLSKMQNDRHWGDHSKPQDKFLGGWQYCIAGHHTVYFSTGISSLLANEYDAFVLGGYAQPAMLRILWHCWRNKIPYVMMTESHHQKNRSKLKKWLKQIVLKKVYGDSAANLVMGKKAKEYVCSYGARAADVFYFPNSIDGPAYGARVRSLRNEKRENFSFLFVGTLNVRKGVFVLLNAFDALRKKYGHASLVLAGRGELQAQVADFIARRNLSSCVTLRGFVAPDELPKHYAAADAFVLPSLDEPFGAVVLEALASGLPVITTKAVGAADDYVVDGRNGFVVDANSIPALEAAMEKVLTQPDVKNKMSEDAERTMQPWTHRALAEHFLSAIARAMKDVESATSLACGYSTWPGE